MEHIDDINCWCKPVVVFTAGKCSVLVHNEGNEIPPAKMIVEAVRLCLLADQDGKHGNIEIKGESE
jgi:hypothetical protein